MYVEGVGLGGGALTAGHVYVQQDIQMCVPTSVLPQLWMVGLAVMVDCDLDQ